MTTSEPPPPDPAADRRARGPVALVFAGGEPLAAADHRQLRAEVGPLADAPPRAGRGVLVVAADSGLHLAQTGGWRVDVVIGDLDSVDADQLRRAEAAGARIERHPAAKAATDLELALDTAVAAGAERIIVAGGHGGRLDHFLANVALLASDRYAEVTMSARLGPAWLHIVRRRAWWTGAGGDLVTLLAVHGPARGVTTEGLLYPLDDATLEPGSTRGVSNEHVVTAAAVTLSEGVVAVVLPGATGTHVLGGDADGPATSPVEPPEPAHPAEPPTATEANEPPAPDDPGGHRVR